MPKEEQIRRLWIGWGLRLIDTHASSTDGDRIVVGGALCFGSDFLLQDRQERQHESYPKRSRFDCFREDLACLGESSSSYSPHSGRLVARGNVRSGCKFLLLDLDGRGAFLD